MSDTRKCDGAEYISYLTRTRSLRGVCRNCARRDYADTGIRVNPRELECRSFGRFLDTCEMRISKTANVIYTP
jgi:hypothetical protein